ncbi:MAG: hypothetical protein AABN34_12165 [Acidobacteriota bacterium]
MDKNGKVRAEISVIQNEVVFDLNDKNEKARVRISVDEDGEGSVSFSPDGMHFQLVSGIDEAGKVFTVDKSK